MALKTTVKVVNISNLSDARYCAGMGVDMLGYVVTEGHPHYISPDLYQEIRGWIAGPQSVAVVYDWDTVKSLDQVVANYAPDLLETDTKGFLNIPPGFDIPLIVSVSTDKDWQVIRSSLHRIAFLQTDETMINWISGLTAELKWIIKLASPENLPDVLSNPLTAGISLSGGPETRPGFKEYDQLADILELLEDD